MCTVLLPPGGYPIAVKYIISYHTILLIPWQETRDSAVTLFETAPTCVQLKLAEEERAVL